MTVTVTVTVTVTSTVTDTVTIIQKLLSVFIYPFRTICIQCVLIVKVTSHWKTVTRTLRPKNVSNGRPGALSGNRSMVRPTTSCEAAWIRKRQRIPPWTVLKAT